MNQYSAFKAISAGPSSEGHPAVELVNLSSITGLKCSTEVYHWFVIIFKAVVQFISSSAFLLCFCSSVTGTGCLGPRIPRSRHHLRSDSDFERVQIVGNPHGGILQYVRSRGIPHGGIL